MSLKIYSLYNKLKNNNFIAYVLSLNLSAKFCQMADLFKII